MAIDRRTLLGLAAAGVAIGPARLVAGTVPGEGEDPAPAERYASAARLPDGSYGVIVFSARGEVERSFPLSARGHDIVQSHDGRRLVVFARRPGTFAVVIDLANREAPVVISARADRHFYGHGLFSPDDRLLYATENDFDGARGVLGVYDMAGGFQRIGELPTHGVGPHDLTLLADGRTLCVANGGIETHPDSGRAKLNLDSMRPSLAFIDRHSGDLVACHELIAELAALSIRHLAADAEGRIWFGGQWQGRVDLSPTLIGRAGPDQPIALLDPLADFGPQLNGYVGSVATSADGRILAASSPRAGRTVLIDTASGRLVGRFDMADCCGVAPAGAREIAVSSGLGDVAIVDRAAQSAPRLTWPGTAFDNHLLRLA
ncbi:MAG: DUF1513 domain-containing protein [Hyphomicrobiaceae bacterium]|nr:DUF1513 domain-containing protein [Hyphomicrobiaceae bacterium]